MPFALKLPRRNPDAPRPSLRERAASLKASAAKVIRRKPPHASPQPTTAADPILAAIAASKAATEAFDAFGKSTSGGGMTKAQRERENALSDAEMKAQRAVWQTVPTTPAGRRALVDFVRYRVAINTHESGEIDDCEYLLGKTLDAFSAMVEGEGQVLPGETIAARVDTYDHRTGLVSYADATGTVRTKPAAEWIAFIAARLNHIARTERSRQFNAACNDLDGVACAELEARLTRELRIDAVNALAHRFDQVFAEAQALRDGGDGAGASAAKVDLTPLTVLQLVNLHDAYQMAGHVWGGVAARPYSVASRDAHGCVQATMVGRLADFEETRAGLISDRIVNEITSRSPKNERERDDILSLRLQHEINCEGRIRDADMMREIAQAWGA